MKPTLLALFAAATLVTARADPLPLPAAQAAAHVLNRIAFGPAPGDLERVTRSGVRAYIDSQLEPAALAWPAALDERLAALETPNRSAGKTLGEFEEARRNARDEAPAALAQRRARVARIARETAEARLLRAIQSPRQLEEVMVDFWFNHFNVAASKGSVQALVASYERDAIRPYVFGSFRQLLGATARHPAMLYYLDNYLSAAPAPASAKASGKGRPRGLNENYARELMELHTLGVDGGYTQRDVTELARMFTGWTFNQRALIGEDQLFRFDPRRHDQGAKTWLGRAVPAQGQAEGEMALDVLAVHPATARHLSYKLAQYFVQDEPPPALVERMARTWQASDGDIRAVLRVLFASDEFMAPASVGAKFKTPYQYVVSAARASAAPLGDIGPLLGTMSQLGMPLYGCQTPDGYKNTEAAWMNPHALTRRIVFATALGAGRLPLGAGAQPAPLQAASSVTPAPLDPQQLESTLGASVSARTRDMVAASPIALRAAMLLGGPDFMQR
ncbi:DUF1800 domain-containing protein [Massilia pseudoviolaceinigra]|uniref:DUF1800 domain-containing protein n=1 Tax=Massilia pseudoviolaceinigra TaxID=3057165 RepID=UPI0027965FFE|nr:DUF1800 domain-containing protein [Massilia sp. CCM 9206]MDQ1923015.1 DUF1800 domain-containing protein [Massilia sp. CCM 9206]